MTFSSNFDNNVDTDSSVLYHCLAEVEVTPLKLFGTKPTGNFLPLVRPLKPLVIADGGGDQTCT